MKSFKEFLKEISAVSDGAPTLSGLSGLAGDPCHPPPPAPDGVGWNAHCQLTNPDNGEHETIEGDPCVWVNPPGGWYDPSYLKWWKTSKAYIRCMEDAQGEIDVDISAAKPVKRAQVDKTQQNLPKDTV